jgi:hypothetical protein
MTKLAMMILLKHVIKLQQSRIILCILVISIMIFLDEKKCVPLVSICDILDLTNLVKRPTCFTKIADPTLNDVILTNSPNNYIPMIIPLQFGFSQFISFREEDL